MMAKKEKLKYLFLACVRSKRASRAVAIERRTTTKETRRATREGRVAPFAQTDRGAAGDERRGANGEKGRLTQENNHKYTTIYTNLCIELPRLCTCSL